MKFLLPVCSETCVWRIRHIVVLLYDADKVKEAASVEDPKDLYESQLSVFLDPFDPEVIAIAEEQGITRSWIESAQEYLSIKWR
jgi:nitrate reductase / nitrite oxidoreductase, beta subunit